MKKKLITLGYLALLSHQINCDGSFGGGFATGAILGTGITLAATSGARNANRDPYYEVDKMRARQEADEIREETRLKREADKKRKKLERQQTEEERRLEHKRDQLAKENRKKNNNNRIKNQDTHKSLSHKEREIKKLELEIKKLELEQLNMAPAA